MQKAATKTKAQVRDDLIMYKFRTKLCTRKRQCRNPSNCFDAHSKIMKRRVPRQVLSNRGLFNYIPEPCEEFLRSKSCRLGDSCPQSHGWLEIIFHPLLYKTKLCKSKRYNGVCSEYGVYCAKAHARFEIRSLVEIYGEHWKRHYDISHRKSITSNDRSRRPSLNLRNKRRFKTQRVGVAVVPKKRQMLDVNLFAQYILNGKMSQFDHPPMCLEQPSPKAALLNDTYIQFEDIESRDVGEKSPDGKSGSSFGSREIMSYTELYSPDIGLNNEHMTNINLIDVVIAKQQESGTYGTMSPSKDSFMDMSRSPSFAHDELQNYF